jgi:hypothetical protein
MQTRQIHAAYMSYLNYQPIPDDLRDCTVPTGLSLKMVEPLEEWLITVEDAAENVSLEIRSRAIMPRAFRPAGGHYTQAVKTRIAPVPGLFLSRHPTQDPASQACRASSPPEPCSRRSIHLSIHPLLTENRESRISEFSTLHARHPRRMTRRGPARPGPTAQATAGGPGGSPRLPLTVPVQIVASRGKRVILATPAGSRAVDRNVRITYCVSNHIQSLAAGLRSCCGEGVDEERDGG